MWGQMIFKRYLNSEQTHRHTHTHIWTNRLIDSIGPEGRCFENMFENGIVSHPKWRNGNRNQVTFLRIGGNLRSVGTLCAVEGLRQLPDTDIFHDFPPLTLGDESRCRITGAIYTVSRAAVLLFL